MTVIGASQLLLPGGVTAAALRAALLSGTAPSVEHAVSLSRPGGVGAGGWRRMSHLARLALCASLPLLDGVDRDGLALVWGTAIGEIVPTARFLTRLFEEGPTRVSPLSFQNSVYNAPASHLSIAAGVRGPVHTVCAGAATGLAALMRGVDLIALGRARRVLVVAGDDASPTLGRALTLSGIDVRAGETMAAVMLEAHGDGPRVSIQPGVSLAPDLPCFARALALPGDAPPAPPDGAYLADPVMGFSPAGGLALLLAAAHGGGTVVDFDDGRAISAQVSG